MIDEPTEKQRKAFRDLPKTRIYSLHAVGWKREKLRGYSHRNGYRSPNIGSLTNPAVLAGWDKIIGVGAKNYGLCAYAMHTHMQCTH